MLVTVMNPGPIKKVSPALLQELDRICATISDTFIREHTEQGAHTGAFSLPVSLETRLDAIDADLSDLSGRLTTAEANIATLQTQVAAMLAAWTVPAFSAGVFTAGGAQTWTVASGDVANFRYRLVGKTMTLAFSLDTTTVGGVANPLLQITIPGGNTAAAPFNNSIHVNDNGTHVAGVASTSTGDTHIYLSKLDFSNFAAAANTTGIYGEITFEIQ